MLTENPHPSYLDPPVEPNELPTGTRVSCSYYESTEALLEVLSGRYAHCKYRHFEDVCIEKAKLVLSEEATYRVNGRITPGPETGVRLEHRVLYKREDDVLEVINRSTGKVERRVRRGGMLSNNSHPLRALVLHEGVAGGRLHPVLF